MKKMILPFVALSFLAACSSTGSQTETQTSTSTLTTADGKTVTTSTTLSTVDPATFKTEMESNPGTILDVRTPEEVAEGTIPGAIVININDNDFGSQLDQLDKTKPVYVYCKAGGRSSRAADILRSKGFPVIFNLDGGITAWISSGFETSK